MSERLRLPPVSYKVPDPLGYIVLAMILVAAVLGLCKWVGFLCKWVGFL